ncbi:hypothetical protein NDU88_006487, partial [Pleurodeles waltl]
RGKRRVGVVYVFWAVGTATFSCPTSPLPLVLAAILSRPGPGYGKRFQSSPGRYLKTRGSRGQR